jgi:hypothetical protein
MIGSVAAYLLDQPLSYLIYIWALCIPCYLFERKYKRDKHEARHIIYFAILFTFLLLAGFYFDAFSSKKEKKSDTQVASSAIFDPKKKLDAPDVHSMTPVEIAEYIAKLQQTFTAIDAEALQKQTINTQRWEAELKTEELQRQIAGLQQAVAAGNKYPWYSPGGIFGTYESRLAEKKIELQLLQQMLSSIPPPEEPPLWTKTKDDLEKYSAQKFLDDLEATSQKRRADFAASLQTGARVRQNGFVFEKDAQGNFNLVSPTPSP